MALPKTYISNFVTGFTLIEVLMVLAMLGFIASATVLFSLSFFNSELLRDEESTLVSLLQTARSNAMHAIDGAAHGVAIDPYGVPEYVLFTGSTLTQATKKVAVPHADIVLISTSSLAEIVFAPLSGVVYGAGQITLMRPGSVASSTLTINYEGAIF